MDVLVVGLDTTKGFDGGHQTLTRQGSMRHTVPQVGRPLDGVRPQQVAKRPQSALVQQLSRHVHDDAYGALDDAILVLMVRGAELLLDVEVGAR